MRKFLVFLLFCVPVVRPVWANDAAAPEVRSADYRLPNGMRVILHPDRSAPLVAVDVWYDVGSGDEVVGRSGFAHLFEHMMFQGSRHTGEDQHFNLLRKAGASNINGTTNTDRTNYYEVLPSNQLETALWLESDRMAWLPDLLTQRSLDNQREVVRNERRQRYDNVPYGKERFALNQLLYAEGHPYRYLTIGRHEDLEAAQLPDVKAFFDKWYAPSNAALCIAGDFDEAIARRLVEKWFAPFPKMLRPAHVIVAPSPLNGPGRQGVEDPFARLRRVHFAWHSPAHFAMGDAELDILAHVLGASGTGRLEKLLVHEKQWAQSVSVYQASARMSSVFHVSVDLRPEADVAAVEQLVLAELARVCAEPISSAELRRAVVSIESGFVWGLESLIARADMLQQYAQMLGKPDGFALDLQRYHDADVAKVQRYAQTVMTEHGRVEVVTMPAGTPGAPPPPMTAPIAPLAPKGGK
jgi:zinc protease